MEVLDLKKSIEQYKIQLREVNGAINNADSNTLNDLVKLKNDIEQLLTLTEEHLQVLESNTQNEISTETAIDEEFNTYMAEMEALGATSSTKLEVTDSEEIDIEEELESLEGMKCQAPHLHSFGETVYHNAIVCGIVASPDNNVIFEQIQVKILFTNPTHQEMLPCPYFLEGDCKFSQDKCRFSHGEIIALAALRDYKDPDYSSIKPGNIVLAKQKNNLWHRAKIKSIDLNNQNCSVQFESNKSEVDLQLEEVLPLGDNQNESSDESDDDLNKDYKEFVVEKSLTNTPVQGKLGDWEKHTKGIGSKLMEKMGYVVGTGLGSKANGRLEPVSAVILPQGKSLDHVMKLREQAGGDEDLFKVEKKLKRLQQKHSAQSKRIYKMSTNEKNIFEFLNKSLKKPTSEPIQKFNKAKHRLSLRKETERQLNVESVKVSENIRKVKGELNSLTTTISRQKEVGGEYNKSILSKIGHKESELNELLECQQNIYNEQLIRENKKKMTIF